MADCVRDDTARDSALLPTQEEEEEIPSVRYCLCNIVNGSDIQVMTSSYSDNKTYPQF